ncbi:MAG: cyclic pyranopterin monophosphate synthase MoaC [Spirochaetaceae bacterium]|nr:cyclic pyranopterin monophosphate synthase MoaC [Spirochaetaceae bacterium]
MDVLTHFDEAGRAVMVDVSRKTASERIARARGRVKMRSETLRVIQAGGIEKGDVLGVARIAGIMAAKQTAHIIPLCHSLNFEQCKIDFYTQDDSVEASVEAECTVKLCAKTGAEMEALTGVTVALLTIYDMCKAIDRAMTLSDIRLEEKSGGKSGRYLRSAG